MPIVYAGIGSNLGDRRANIDRALLLLKEYEEFEILAVSQIIETPFQGEGPEQGPYLNGAIKIKTDLLPLEVLSRFKMVERRLGRMKSGVSNAPRPMDLDILFYDDVVIVDGKNLCIPHPRLAERRFVLEPLAEIAPDFVHPRFQKTVLELYRNLLDANHPEPQGA